MWAIVSSRVSDAHRALCSAVIGLTLASTCALAAEIDQAKAAGVMAAYLRHIASLTSWPAADTAGGSTAQPIRFGVIGDDPNGVMQPIRERTETGNTLLAQGRPIMLVELAGEGDPANLEQLATCHLLFLSAGAELDWNRIRPVVGSLPIVTVSDMEGFADQGGMIEYFIDHRSGKVHMKANLDAMRTAGISMSARFLTLNSVVVIGEREEAS